ncbi:SDR family NAD(P)-dependent oxidoreductase [Flavitalea flava]
MKNSKVCLITGADEGPGLFLTERLLEKGYQVAAICQGRFLSGRDLLLLSADLTNENDVQKAIRQTFRRFGKIDIVVNAAGYRPFEKESGSCLCTFSDKAVSENFEEQLFGSFHVLRQIMPLLKKQGSGHIFSFPDSSRISSIADTVIYTATRLAIESLSSKLIRELKTLGIRFTLLDAERSGPGYDRQHFSEPDRHKKDLYKWIFQKMEAVQLNPITRNISFYERTVPDDRGHR